LEWTHAIAIRPWQRKDANFNITEFLLRWRPHPRRVSHRQSAKTHATLTAWQFFAELGSRYLACWQRVAVLKPGLRRRRTVGYEVFEPAFCSGPSLGACLESPIDNEWTAA
jgi:hypothetical protein